MRQRNDTGYPLNSPDVGRQIAAGEEFSHPVQVTGCTSLEPPAQDEAPETAPGDEDAAPARGKRKITSTASEGESA